MKRHSHEVLNKLLPCEAQKSCDVMKLFRKNLYSEFKRDRKSKLQKSRTICYNFTYFAQTFEASKLNEMQATELDLENGSCEKQEEKPVTLKDIVQIYNFANEKDR